MQIILSAMDLQKQRKRWEHGSMNAAEELSEEERKECEGKVVNRLILPSLMVTETALKENK